MWGLGGAPGEASQAEGPEPAPHPPSRRLYLIWRRRDPTRVVWRPVEMPPGQEMTGVSEGTGNSASRIRSACGRGVAQSSGSPCVSRSTRACRPAERILDQPAQSPNSTGRPEAKTRSFLLRVLSEIPCAIQGPATCGSLGRLSACKVLCKRSPGGSLGIGSVAQPRRTMKRNV